VGTKLAIPSDYLLLVDQIAREGQITRDQVINGIGQAWIEAGKPAARVSPEVEAFYGNRRDTAARVRKAWAALIDWWIREGACDVLDRTPAGHA
jgi:hypothetical protein